MSITVAIVEDNGELREGLAQLIKQAPGFSCSGAFANCEHFFEQMATKRIRAPRIVLMDIGLPGMSGIEGVQRTKELFPKTDVMMFTVFEDERKIFDSICAGASGYLLKKTPPHRILEALQELNEGGAPMTAAIARKVLSAFQQLPLPQQSSTFQLSERELEVLAALVQGLSYKMIGDKCFISIDTVRSHIRHIYEKLHVNSKTQAIALAMKNRLV